MTTTNSTADMVGTTANFGGMDVVSLFGLICGPLGTATVNALNTFESMSLSSLLAFLPGRRPAKAHVIQELVDLRVLHQEGLERITLNRLRLAELCRVLAREAFPGEQLLS